MTASAGPITVLPPVPAELANRGVALRLQGESDLDFVREVYVAYRWEEMERTGWPQEIRRAFLEDQFRLQYAQYSQCYPGAAFGIIEVNGAPAGRLYLMRREEELRIMDIAFVPPYRNQGIGGGLIRAVQEQARAAGIPRVSIHVERENPAQRLYRRLGFEPVHENGIYLLLEWRPDTATCLN